MASTPTRATGAIGPLNDQLMNSAIRNLTRSRNKVVEFIEKEENLHTLCKFPSWNSWSSLTPPMPNAKPL